MTAVLCALQNTKMPRPITSYKISNTSVTCHCTIWLFIKHYIKANINYVHYDVCTVVYLPLSSSLFIIVLILLITFANYFLSLSSYHCYHYYHYYYHIYHPHHHYEYYHICYCYYYLIVVIISYHHHYCCYYHYYYYDYHHRCYY